MNLNS